MSSRLTEVLILADKVAAELGHAGKTCLVAAVAQAIGGRTVPLAPDSTLQTLVEHVGEPAGSRIAVGPANDCKLQQQQKKNVSIHVKLRLTSGTSAEPNVFELCLVVKGVERSSTF